MPSCSSAVTFAEDIDQFRAALRPANSTLTLTAPGRFAARHTRVNLHRLRMQAAQESLPRVWEGEIPPERRAISFLSAPGPQIISNGAAIGLDDIALHNATDMTLCQRLSGATHWGSLSLTTQDWSEIGIAVTGFDLTPRADLPRITASRPAMARLRRLHSAAIYLAEQAPGLITNADSARGLEQALIQAVIDCLRPPFVRESTAAQRHHTMIMRRFRSALEENTGKPIYLPQLCIAVGVSDRTLRLCCQEHLGFGPKRYLFLRSMHLTHLALRSADPSVETVTDIATRFGFWELGRFAVAYRALFGEPPSATLRRIP